MNLNLFGKKDNKDSQDKMQTQEVKEAATTPNQDEEKSVNPFVNPFNDNQGNRTNDMPPPIENEPHTEVQTNQEEPHEDLFAENHFEHQSEQPIPQMSSQQPPNQPQKEVSQPNPTEEMDTHLESVQREQPQNFDQIQEMIDETVEKIIDDKWDKVVSNVEKVLNWKDQLEGQVNLVKEDIVSMKENFEALEKKITTKLSNYDRDILDVGSEIKALEKVFQKITPTLVNNVNELSKIAKELKGEDFDLPSNDKKQS